MFLKLFSKLTVCTISFKNIKHVVLTWRTFPFLLKEPIYILNNIKILTKILLKNIGFKSQQVPRV